LGLPHGDALRRMIAAFYRVRFGAVQLTNEELTAIDAALIDLERRPAS
jgi:hypothetical protein